MTMRRSILAFLLLLAFPAGASIEADIVRNAPAAASYKAELLRLIRGARRIVIVEHSNPLDLGSVDGRAPAPRPERVYGVRTLNDEQRAYFLLRIGEVAPDLPTWSTACAFVDHHTIYFFEGTGDPVRMHICFHCGDVEWTGKSKAVPLDLIDALSDEVKANGLSPERDWRALMSSPRND